MIGVTYSKDFNDLFYCLLNYYSCGFMLLSKFNKIGKKKINSFLFK